MASLYVLILRYKPKCYSFPGSTAVKNLSADAGDTGDVGLNSGRSSGGGHGSPLQHSCLESPMDRGTEGHKESDVTEGTEHTLTEMLWMKFYKSKIRLKTI